MLILPPRRSCNLRRLDPNRREVEQMAYASNISATQGSYGIQYSTICGQNSCLRKLVLSEYSGQAPAVCVVLGPPLVSKHTSAFSYKDSTVHRKANVLQTKDGREAGRLTNEPKRRQQDP